MVPIIPRPVYVESGDGELPLAVVSVADSLGADGVLERLVRVLEGVGSRLAIGDDASATVVRIRQDETAGPEGSDDPERYTLKVSARGIELRAPGREGLLHAVHTLRQVVVQDARGGTPKVPSVVVRDAPRYRWRGLSVDVARHFFGLDHLTVLLDVLASYKLNVLHVHLTDDQAWRLESPSRPLLTERSSGTAVGGSQGGYLSVEDFRVLQDRAAALGIRVVPEIDVPGHVNAATHAYGELMPDGVPTDVYTGDEVGFSKLTLDLAATEPFLRDVFGDLARATDGEYLHIGGDEALRMKADEYAGFVELCERIVLDAGKQVAAWQEAAHAPARAGTLIQFWDPREDASPFVGAAQRGARFVMSPGDRVYLDMKYTEDHPLGQDWAGLVELRDSYDWDPEDVVPGLPATAIEGVEAAIWTETISTVDELFSMLLPRLSAVAEVAWTPRDVKDWVSFRERVAVEAGSWRRAGLAYHPTPQVDW